MLAGRPRAIRPDCAGRPPARAAQSGGRPAGHGTGHRKPDRQCAAVLAGWSTAAGDRQRPQRQDRAARDRLRARRPRGRQGQDVRALPAARQHRQHDGRWARARSIPRPDRGNAWHAPLRPDPWRRPDDDDVTARGTQADPAPICRAAGLRGLALPDRERMVAAMNFDNLVAVLAIAAAVPLILAAVPRVRVPGPVLEIVAGIVIGPAVLGLVKPDQAVRLVSTIGLAFLLFLAGLEIDVRHFRGPRARLAGLALGLSVLLALIVGIVLYAAGVVESPLLVGIILIATSLGLIIPILEDAGVADSPVGQFAIAGASLGEVSPVVLLSLFFSGRATAIGPKLLLLSLLGALVVLVVVGTLRIERSTWITKMINRLADTSAQIRIRLSMLLVVGLGAVATHLGFEAILGAFIAGAILRLVDADAEDKHPLFHPKLEAIGYGFLIPVFFVASGLTFNLSVLFSSASTLLRVPLFLLALLVVRALPAVLYRSALGSIRDVAAVGLLQATSLPFIVAATTIGLQVHAISPANAAALVAAGLFSVILFPVISLQLLRSSAKGPGMVPEQDTFAGGHVR